MTASDAYHSATDTLSALSYTHETMQLHYNGAVRGMVTSSDDSWETFNAAAIARLGNLPAGLLMKFEDPQDNGEVEKVVRLPKKCLTADNLYDRHPYKINMTTNMRWLLHAPLRRISPGGGC